MIKIEIDGLTVEVAPGTMVIEAADAAGIPIPRFCYHKKLSIAANCRMCLVDVEKAPKPMPACATPVTDGMKIQTQSARARAAQKAVMEFLLINHPLDCPICDQAGECELQDLALTWGGDLSSFTLGKRAVVSGDIGPLIATEMTRCIHCTRCVRFGEEVSGVRELGATGRGEHMEIGTFIEKNVNSELSGNIIDLCPVGALTSKPFRFKARSFEMMQMPGIGSQDSLGSNLYYQVYKGKVARVVPRENESINEVWLSDRDRFAYLGLESKDCRVRPLIKKPSGWEATDWSDVLVHLEAAKDHFALERGNIAALASPNSTTEELYLLQKMLRTLGSNDIDVRVRQLDFADEGTFTSELAGFPDTIASLESKKAILTVGAHLSHEHPLLAHRVRKGIKHGMAYFEINPICYDNHFDVSEIILTPYAELPEDFGAILKAAHEQGVALSAAVQPFVINCKSTTISKTIFEQLTKAGTDSAVLLGALSLNHSQASILKTLAVELSRITGAKLGFLSEGCNMAGAIQANALPAGGRDALSIQAQPAPVTILMNLEPEFDCVMGQAMIETLKSSFVIVISPFSTPMMQTYADMILPCAAFAETIGSYVNLEGRTQSFRPAVMPVGEARPAWKILRVIANALSLPGFDFQTCDDVHDEMTAMPKAEPLNKVLMQLSSAIRHTPHNIMRVSSMPIYRGEGVLRRSEALQSTDLNLRPAVRLNLHTAQKHGLKGTASVAGVLGHVEMPVIIDESIANETALIPAGWEETSLLGAQALLTFVKGH